MKKIFISLLILASFLFPTVVQANSAIDNAVHNLFQNIENRTQNNEQRAKILENMIVKLNHFYNRTSNDNIRFVIIQLKLKMNQQIKKYRGNTDYITNAIVERLLRENTSSVQRDSEYEHSSSRRYYENDEIKIYSQYESTNYYDDVEKNDRIKLGKFKTNGGKNRDKTDVTVRFETRANNFRLKNVYIISDGEKIYADKSRGTVYPNRSVTFYNVPSHDVYTIYGQIDRIKESDIRITTRFYDADDAELRGTDIFWITKIKDSIIRGNNDNVYENTERWQKIYMSVDDEYLEKRVTADDLDYKQKVWEFELSGSSREYANVYIRFQYSYNDSRNVSANRVFLDSSRGKIYGTKVYSDSYWDVYKFSHVKWNTDYKLYVELCRKKYGGENMFVRFEKADFIRNSDDFTNKLLGKIFFRD